MSWKSLHTIGYFPLHLLWGVLFCQFFRTNYIINPDNYFIKSFICMDKGLFYKVLYLYHELYFSDPPPHKNMVNKEKIFLLHMFYYFTSLQSHNETIATMWKCIFYYLKIKFEMFHLNSPMDLFIFIPFFFSGILN